MIFRWSIGQIVLLAKVGFENQFLLPTVFLTMILILLLLVEPILAAVEHYFVESSFVIAEQATEEGVLVERCVAGIEFDLQFTDPALPAAMD